MAKKLLPVSALTGDVEVKAFIDRARKRVAAFPVSDIVDSDGNQYVDLVMEGGGVLGVALAGYSYVLEQAGIRFLGLGGTSAGSINALVIAALGPPHAKKGEKVAEIVANVPMNSFIDGDGDARDFTDAIVEGAGRVKLAWKAAQVIDNFTEDLGLHPGKAFGKWLRDQLGGSGIQTLAELRTRMEEAPPNGGYDVKLCPVRDTSGVVNKDGIKGSLAVIAADITTGTKVEFPKMAPLYWALPDTINPAEFVRASMSVPAFFHPVRLGNIPQGPDAKKRWDDLTSYKGKELPTECVLVDGGIISNFPIAVFHSHSKVPRAPTFGVKLGKPAASPKAVDGPGDLLGGVFNAARGALDQDFLIGNPDYRHLIAYIDTKKHKWLNFRLPDADKIDLFREGARAAADFLETFEWQKYKALRAQKAKLRAMDADS